MSAVPGPVRVGLEVPALVRAGLGAVLEPYRDRVVLLGPQASADAELEIFDPLGCGRPDACAERLPIPLIGLVHPDDELTVARAYELGADLVLSLSAHATEVVTAIEDVHAAPPSHRPDPLALSSREVEVVTRICRGLSNAEIAQDMFLSINSIKTYIRLAYRKIGVSRRSQAVLWGLEHGLDVPRLPLRPLDTRRGGFSLSGRSGGTDVG